MNVLSLCVCAHRLLLLLFWFIVFLRSFFKAVKKMRNKHKYYSAWVCVRSKRTEKKRIKLDERKLLFLLCVSVWCGCGCARIYLFAKAVDRVCEHAANESSMFNRICERKSWMFGKWFSRRLDNRIQSKSVAWTFFIFRFSYQAAYLFATPSYI